MSDVEQITKDIQTIEHVRHGFGAPTSAAFGRAAEAYKKQIPKKILRVNAVWPDGQDRIRLLCPSCREEISQNEKCCSECGQKLDWSDENG